MSSFLLSALLSQCHDIEKVLDTLCWPSYSWPEIEKVESLHTLIGGLIKQFHSNEDVFKDYKTKERVGRKVQSVIWDQCVPLLKLISNANLSSWDGDDAQNAKNKEMLNAVCGLLGACISQCQTDSLEEMARVVLPVLTGSDSDARDADTHQLDIDTAIEVTAVLLTGISQNAALTMKCLSCTITSIKELSDAQVSKIIVRIWFASLKSSTEERRADILHCAWEDLLSWHDREDTEAVTARVLLCLTAFSDYLFPLDQQLLRDRHLRPDPRTSQHFFRVVQAGLTHRDSVSRKRALYLLKKCVSLSEALNTDVCMCGPDEVLFRWTPDQRLVFREFWEDYALVLETLEENQIHVVRPVLHRLDAVAETTGADAEGGALVHPSWLLCVYQRMFHSENKAVMKAGVNHLLGLRLLQSSAYASSVSKFVVGPFMDALTETSLYHRSPGQAIGECPELGLKLQNFMVTFFRSLPEENQGSVMLGLLRRLASSHWCAVPLFFVCHALSRLPPRPLLDADGLRVLREVLRCTMITHQVLLRGATQCFLLHAAICLTDVSAVTLEEVFAFLAQFRADESLQRDTSLWSELRDWLLANEARFRPAGACADSAPQRVWVYSSECLKAFLMEPASPDDQAVAGVTATVAAAAGEAEVVARSLLLSADVEADRLEHLLRPLLDVLHRLGTCAYLPARKADKSLQVALRLLQLLGPSSGRRAESGDKVAVALERLLFSTVEPVQEFILRRLNGELQEVCDLDKAALYHSVLREFVKTYCSVPGYLANLQKNYVSRLTVNCMRILNTPCEQVPSRAGQVQKAVTMATLALLCEPGEERLLDPASEAARSLRALWTWFCSPPPSSSSATCFTQTLQKPSCMSACSGSDDSPPLRDWGRVAARFVRDQWVCLSFLHRSGAAPADKGGAPWRSAALAAALDALALLPGCLALPALDFIRAVLPQVVPQEEALCAEVVSASWRLVQASSTNSDFWPTLRAFVRLAFQPSTLELTEAQSPALVLSIRRVTAELMELAQVKSGVLNELIQHCSRTWLPSETDPSADSTLPGALNHLDVLTEACVYGPVFRRDQRIIQEVQTYVEQLGEECAANTVIGSATRDDQYPRLCALALLSRLDAHNDLQQSLMEQLVERLLGKDEEISKSKGRYYSNSLQHRLKNRVWQMLLVLLPKLRQDFVAGRVLPATLRAAACGNQASVKYLIEWALILTLHLWPTLISQLWDCFSANQETTKTSVSVLLSVLVHLGVLLPRMDSKVEQWQKAVEVVLLRCFSHIFSVRLYALLALKRLWALETQHALGGGAAAPGLATAVHACLHQAEVMQCTGNAMKNWSKIQEHFFFSSFHPLQDYSVETIFHTFPCLSDLADDEWVPVWKFEKLVDFRSDSSLPLRNVGRVLSELRPGDWVQQDQGELERDERWADVQKKITPWRLSVQEQEPELMAQQRAARLGKLTGALLVVASLIDKPTNLGGLCRTCEIFGASALVLDSLHHINDKQFQALSVSSELWLPLLEVKPFELVDFLPLKKQDGYCIVGVEQTANSQSLQDYAFPEKTLLLLGNEREGIPANLLQLLDVCVEIPQQGVTRSLNVHVSAALLVWEYTKQHRDSGRTP